MKNKFIAGTIATLLFVTIAMTTTPVFATHNEPTLSEEMICIFKHLILEIL